VGKSLLPIFKGKQREPHTELYWRFNRANAIRQGNLKAIRVGQAWELYNLENDPTELNNLASQMPEKTNALAEMWEKWNQAGKSRPKGK
jgi:arylsulfatase A-like enzyme